MKISYDQARKDHEYLWSISPAEDMTGGYVDQHDLDRLLKNPTKATARDCYCDQIDYWFQNGPDKYDSGGLNYDTLAIENPELREIEERHNITYIPW